MMKMKMKRTPVRNYALEFVLIIFAAVHIYPLFLIFADAFKTREEMAYNPFGIPGASGFTYDNIMNAIVKMKFYIPLTNSILIALGSTVLLIVISALAAYPLARSQSTLYKFIYLLFLSGIIVPYQLAMIPLYKLVIGLGFVNSHLGMILIYGGILISFPIFFYSGFIKSVPRELEEAASIDGCGRYGLFWRIVFPLLKPATAAVVVLNLLNIWNEFGLSLLFLQKTGKMTITVALYAFRGQYFSHWPHMFAGVLVAVIPIIVIFVSAQKYFIRGAIEGALKG